MSSKNSVTTAIFLGNKLKISSDIFLKIFLGKYTKDQRGRSSLIKHNIYTSSHTKLKNSLHQLEMHTIINPFFNPNDPCKPNLGNNSITASKAENISRQSQTCVNESRKIPISTQGLYKYPFMNINKSRKIQFQRTVLHHSSPLENQEIKLLQE